LMTNDLSSKKKTMRNEFRIVFLKSKLI